MILPADSISQPSASQRANTTADQEYRHHRWPQRLQLIERQMSVVFLDNSLITPITNEFVGSIYYTDVIAPWKKKQQIYNVDKLYNI